MKRRSLLILNHQMLGISQQEKTVVQVLSLVDNCIYILHESSIQLIRCCCQLYVKVSQHSLQRFLYHALLLLRFFLHLYKLQQLSGNLKQFCCYVVFRKCDCVYPIEQCKERNNTSKRCQFVRFPDHRYARMRQSCNMLLLKTDELSSGKRLLYPQLTYCYLSIKNSLCSLLRSFLTDCESGEQEFCRTIHCRMYTMEKYGVNFRCTMAVHSSWSPFRLHSLQIGLVQAI